MENLGDLLVSFNMCSTSAEPVLRALGAIPRYMRAPLGGLSRVRTDAGVRFELLFEGP